ncbi:hypothetical protein [Actinoallomurus iriomotensis]|uniref:Uncharacterized protein n=1 Tax=Actinoallomurus iriomotensis TaxID=478107 RepID=A0A9W6RR28_9ACTN|nr:hypothetical protein [Actinoallomurus iriomotensis]GLY78572.1 hypothetical protein Airi01_068390 [Actinoallomurus iriomotensis]
MRATRNPDGTLTVPMRAETGGIIGDALVTIGPDHPDYEAWDAWLRRVEAEDGA